MDYWGMTELGYFTRVSVIPNYFPLFEGLYSPSKQLPISVPWGGITGTVADQADLVTYVANRLADLVNSAPTTLDTLNELATALGNDPNFATTIATRLGTDEANIQTNTTNVSAALAAVLTKLTKASNLSDLTDFPTARTNLGVYSKAEVDAKIPAGVTQYYTYGGFAVSGITADEVLFDHIVVTAHTLQPNLPAAKASVGTAPAAIWTGIIQQNGVQIGTLSIASNGTCTFATGSANPIAVVAGDVISLIAPHNADANIARLRWTFRGILS